MGAGVSSALGPEFDGGGANEIGLGELPESCVAELMTHLDPTEICQLARINRAFRGAASADFVWEGKLPPNYKYLLEKASVYKVLEGVSKKEIYAQLCRWNPFDGGTKEFSMEKKGGGVSMLISSKALAITGIDDRRYWNYIPTEESSYTEQGWRMHGSDRCKFIDDSDNDLYAAVNGLSRMVSLLLFFLLKHHYPLPPIAVGFA